MEARTQFGHCRQILNRRGDFVNDWLSPRFEFKDENEKLKIIGWINAIEKKFTAIQVSLNMKSGDVPIVHERKTFGLPNKQSDDDAPQTIVLYISVIENDHGESVFNRENYRVGSWEKYLQYSENLTLL